MVDAQANIRVNLDSSQALAQLKALEKQISAFNKNLVQGSSTVATIQKDFNQSLIEAVNATGKFSASMGKVMTETERFSNALENNKLSAKEYFRYSAASTKSFGKLFSKEFSTISKVAEERVKLLQTRHIELGRAADGAMRAVRIVPDTLDYSKPMTQMQLAIQKQQIFNQLLDNGTTKLLNFGKNTQWAGRQLMVGFTVPLSIFGGVALRTFKQLEEQAIRFKKVYGDMFTSEMETQRALESIQTLAKEFTKYGMTVTETMKIAADAAAAGNAGEQLENVVAQTAKLSILGGISSEKAFDAAIAIQNAFRTTGKELEETINFLNAVENQTVVALEDITEAIPRVASVISTLGGDVKDLAFFMAAMKEGGVQAADGANALKTSLGRLINPTKAAVEAASDLGINLKGIVEQNAGDLRTIMLTFANAVKPLDDLAKARLMEKVFGKFQFARMSTLFDNLSRSGNQAARVLQLTTASAEELAILAERELGVVADSAATKLAASMEKLKLAIAPLGEAFAKVITPIAEFATKLLEKFNGLSDGTKKIITTVLLVLGGIGPVFLMMVGLVANGIANILKFVNLLRKGYQSLTMGGQALGMSTNYLSTEQLEALSVANNLHNIHERLTDQYALEAGALARLIDVYNRANATASQFASQNPTFFRNTPVPGKIQKFADGGWVPGSGNKDTVPAVLMPGEFVVRKDAAQQNSQVLEKMNNGGQTYRSKGTPAFSQFVERSGGSEDSIYSSAGTPVASQTKKMIWASLEDENRAIMTVGKRLGLSEEVIKRDLIGKNASHIGGIDPRQMVDDGFGNLIEVKTFNAKDLMADNKAVNQYLNSLERTNLENKPWAIDLDGNVSPRIIQEAKKITGLSDSQISDIARRQILDGVAPQSQQELDILGIIGKENFKVSPSGMGRQGIATRAVSVVRKLFGKRNPGQGFYETLENRKYDSSLDERTTAVMIRKTRNAGTLIRDRARQLGFIQGTVSQVREGKADFAATGRLPKRVSDAIENNITKDQLVRQQRGQVTQTTQRKGVVGSPKIPSRVQTPVGSPRFRKNGTPSLKNFAMRSSGTPAYGEQGVTPALLTPGEFVVNSQATQQYGPQLVGMNQGGVALRAGGTPYPIPPDGIIPIGYEADWNNPGMMIAKQKPVKQTRMQQIKSAAIEKIEKSPTMQGFGEYMDGGSKEEIRLAKERQRHINSLEKAGASAEEIAKVSDKYSKKMNEIMIKENDLSAKFSDAKESSIDATEGVINATNENANAQAQTTDLEKKKNKLFARNKLPLTDDEKRARSQMRMQRASTASMIGFGVSGAMMGLSQVEGPIGEISKKLMPATMAISGILGMLPLMANPLVGLAVIATGLFVAYQALRATIDNARKKSFELAQAMGNTSEDLKAMGEMTGKVAASEIADRQKTDRLRSINPLRSDFGVEFMQSDLGKKMLKDAQDLGPAVNSAEVLGSKLADYISQGVLDAAQAQSIAQEIGRQFGGETYSLSIVGKMQELVGVNGQDLFTNPLEVRVKMIEESKNQLAKMVNELPMALQKIESEKMFDGYFLNTETFAKEWNQFIKNDFKPNWIQLADFATGVLMKPLQTAAFIATGGASRIGSTSFAAQKDTAALGGQQAGMSSFYLENTQKAIDSFQVQMQNKEREYSETRKILEAELKITENLDKKSQIQQRLVALSIAEANLKTRTEQGTTTLINEQAEALKFITESFTKAGPAIQKEMNIAMSESVTAKYKDTPLAAVAEQFLSQTEEFKDQELTYNINAILSSGTMDLPNLMAMLNTFVDPATGKPQETEIQAVMQYMVEAHGFDGLNRALTSTSEILDSVQRKNTITYLRKLDSEGFNAANSFLELASGLDNLDVNMTEVTEQMSPQKMKGFIEAGEDIAKVDEMLPDKITKEALIEFSQSDEDFAGIESNVEWFDSLPDEQTKLAVQVFRTILETIDMDKMKSDMQERRAKEGQSFTYGSTNPFVQAISDDQAMEAAIKQAMDKTKKYFGPGGIFSSQFDEATEGGGSKGSIPITTAQLIELRLKGIDPAAAAQLDYAEAALILSKGVKQQKNAIKNLNDELRNNAIKSQLLKSDQEVLQDTMKATTDAVGAYITMIEQTKIKPIQDQIDAFNKLTNTQQDQIEKYQRALKGLSDKEDRINKIYDERVDAISRVSKANERSEERQRRQIDLASALTSGDIAAAAAAASDISRAESEYKIEDTRTALENARQEELKNLTVEINGQLFTREQIENNLKNIEEEIYQRSLLIRQEQEKIAEIEKRITAEKEKQRRIQGLIQIMQISEQLKTTVDPRQRNLLVSQMGFVGESIGVSDLSKQGQFNQIGQELGIDLSNMAQTIKTSIKLSETASLEMIDTADSVKKNVKNISKFMSDGTVQAEMALGFLKTLNRGWGDKNIGIAATGISIKDSMFSARNSLILGKKALEDVISTGLKSISLAAEDARKSIANDKSKVTTAAFGGLISGYMMGGKVKGYMMGGRVNYKGSNEPAPVRMATGSIVPGLGNTDRVPALLTPGEFVVRKSVAEENMGFLKALNGNVFPSSFGPETPEAVPSTILSSVQNTNNLYNTYSVNVNVPNTNASPEEIANVVINKIRRASNSNVRGIRY